MKEKLLQKFATLSKRPDDIICFEAALPPIQSAIKLDGQEGARIQLDVPETSIDEILRLHRWKQHTLIVAVVRER